MNKVLIVLNYFLPESFLLFWIQFDMAKLFKTSFNQFLIITIICSFD